MTTAIIIGLALCVVFLLGQGITVCMSRYKALVQEQTYSDGWAEWGTMTDLRRAS
jgi:hypothetical protein